MAKFVHPDIQDSACTYLKNNADRLCVCSAQPADYADATTTHNLATRIIGSANFTGPANGDVSGRKITVDAQNDVPVTTSGNATHVALCDSVNEKLLEVSTCNEQALTAGNSVNVAAHDLEFRDPELDGRPDEREADRDQGTVESEQGQGKREEWKVESERHKAEDGRQKVKMNGAFFVFHCSLTTFPFPLPLKEA